MCSSLYGIIPVSQSILVCYQGSIAHGTYIEGHIDDEDILAVVVPGIEYYYGLRKFGRQGTKVIQRDQWDITMHEVRKFISLCAKGNPNVLSALWIDEADIILDHYAGQHLRARRDLFATKKAYNAFAGYASSQLKRMTKVGEYQGYMGAKRKALVNKHGYDPKNASHLIRLLRLGIEFLETGNLTVKRPDAMELLAIKQGEWSLERVQSHAEELFEQARVTRDKSTLPDKPDMDAVNKLCVEVVKMGLGIL